MIAAGEQLKAWGTCTTLGKRRLNAAQAPAAAGGTTAGHMGVGGWLQGANQNLAQYGDALAEYGYEDAQLLAEATDEELLEAFAELSMKKPHQKLLLRSISALRAQSS